MKPLLTIILLLFLQNVFAQGNQACADTSYRMQFSSPGKDFGFYTHCNTIDGGTVLIGRLTDTLNSSLSNTVVIKLSTTGTVVWKTAFQNLPGNKTYFSRIIEQSNGEIAAYGYTTGLNTTNTREIILLKLQANGNLAWAKNYSLTNHFNQQDLLHPFFISEGQNNDLLLTIGGEHYDGNSDSVYSVMARISNAGNIVWSKALTNDTNVWWMKPSGIYTVGNELIVLGHIDNIAAPCDFGLLSIYVLKMDYSNGQPLMAKSYCYAPSLSNSFQAGGSEERDWFNSVRLTDGRFVLFGRFSAVTDRRHAYKMVFDDQLSLVQAREYNVPNTTTHLVSRFSVLPDGTSHFYYLNGVNSSLYWASLDSSNKIIRQRKIAFDPRDNTIGGFLNFGYRNNDTYNFSTNYRINSRRYSLFTQVQRNDLAIDSCLGTDTSFVRSNPLGFSATSWNWQTIIDNPLIAVPINLTQSDFIIETENLCTQISRCDSLNIFGPDTLCVSNKFINFAALKNPDCRKRVLWEINNSLVDSSYQPNDSTLSIRFKMPQNGIAQTMQLFASAANCTIAKNTAQIVLLPGVNPLPPDTVVCSAVNIKLSPGKWGKNYLWQNGSTDSVFTATDTGRYFVKVETYCGDIFYDTISITKAAISAGTDKTICKGDTAMLHASAGFINYQWSSNGIFTTVSDSVIKAHPSVTAQYIASAQTVNGCAVKDTVNVIVLQPPVINLGNDTTFCEGDSVLLRSSASFNSYQWSNGSIASFINVKSSGSYWLKVTDSNNCISADTIDILPLHPSPFVAITPEEIVCIGKTDTLKTTNSFVSYQWNNGSTLSYLTVGSTGTYWLNVIDNNGCRGSDTVTITQLVQPPKDFLHADTIVCAGTSLELKPLQSFNRYLWSNGASSPFIEVTNGGLYSLLVSDRNNCKGADSIIVTFKNCPNRILFPSAFTPNDDNRNDIFKSFVQGRLAAYRFTVYNRWGQIVFVTTDYRKGWDGYMGGLLQNTGAFVWVCSYQFEGEEKNTVKGSVMLIR